jgi:hypothetical protein
VSGESARDAGFDDRESDSGVSSDQYDPTEGVQRLGRRTLPRVGPFSTGWLYKAKRSRDRRFACVTAGSAALRTSRCAGIACAPGSLGTISAITGHVAQISQSVARWFRMPVPTRLVRLWTRYSENVLVGPEPRPRQQSTVGVGEFQGSFIFLGGCTVGELGLPHLCRNRGLRHPSVILATPTCRRESRSGSRSSAARNRRFIWASPEEDRRRSGPYDGRMKILRWTCRALVLAVAVGGSIRLIARRTGPPTNTGWLFPPIGGDTWPPVPVKDARPG